jgi:hypothetical protein
MPDFSARRVLTRWEERSVLRGLEDPVEVRHEPLEVVERSAARVEFRQGQELVEAPHGSMGPTDGLASYGFFGPLLGIIMQDVLNGKMGFSHWERTTEGRVAVFQFEVGEASSHYPLQFCCYLGRLGLPREYNAIPGYQGQLSVDPDSGAVRRLLLKADLRPSPFLSVDPDNDIPLLVAEVTVEYGWVEIGGVRYMCPTSGTSVMTSWTLGAAPRWKWSPDEKPPRLPLEKTVHSRVTAINQYRFVDFHAFRGRIRMVE